MTYNEFKKTYSMEVLSYVKQDKNDPNITHKYMVRVTHKKEQVFDDYTFDSWCSEAEPMEGYLGRSNPYLGEYIIKRCHEIVSYR